MAISEERLRKIKTLAERGEENEKQSAAEFLDKLMKKYGYTYEDLNNLETEEYQIRYKSDIEKRLLIHVSLMVLENDWDKIYTVSNVKTKRKYKYIQIVCTKEEKMRIDFYYKFYKEALNSEMEKLLTVFISKNNIFAETTSEKEEREEESQNSKYTLEEIAKLRAMYNGLGDYSRHSLLEEKDI